MRVKIRIFAQIFLSLPVLAIGITGCGNQAEETVAISRSEIRSNEEIGTDGQLILIQSDNVRAAGYDFSSLVMTVQFDHGAIYEYYDVPPDLWTSFIAAQPHPWSQVGYPRIVQGGIPYMRIG